MCLASSLRRRRCRYSHLSLALSSTLLAHILQLAQLERDPALRRPRIATPVQVGAGLPRRHGQPWLGRPRLAVGEGALSAIPFSRRSGGAGGGCARRRQCGAILQPRLYIYLREQVKSKSYSRQLLISLVMATCHGWRLLSKMRPKPWLAGRSYAISYARRPQFAHTIRNTQPHRRKYACPKPLCPRRPSS